MIIILRVVNSLWLILGGSYTVRKNMRSFPFLYPIVNIIDVPLFFQYICTLLSIEQFPQVFWAMPFFGGFKVFHCVWPSSCCIGHILRPRCSLVQMYTLALVSCRMNSIFQMMSMRHPSILFALAVCSETFCQCLLS